MPSHSLFQPYIAMNYNSFRVVVLDCPYNSWSKTETQRLFSSTVEMKLRGYQPVYEHGVMPVDSYDFIATHLLVCAEEGRALKPVTGFKSVTLSRCRKFNLPFPTSPLLRSHGEDAAHSRAVEAIIRRCEEQEKEVVFDSSWTVDPEIRSRREFTRVLQELFISNVIHWHAPEKRHEVLGTGILRVRTNRFFERVGFQQVQYDGEPLPPFGQASLQGASAVLIHFREGSSFARDVADAHHRLWENRITIQ